MPLTIRLKDDDETVIATADENSDDVIVLENNWYFAPECVNMDYLAKTERTYNCPYKGQAIWYDVASDDVQAKNIAWCYETPDDEYEHIAGRIAFYSRETSATNAITDADDTAKSA